MELKLVPIAFSFIFYLLLQDGVQRQWLLRSSSVFVLEHLPTRISFTAIVPHRVTIQTSRFSEAVFLVRLETIWERARSKLGMTFLVSLPYTLRLAGNEIVP